MTTTGEPLQLEELAGLVRGVRSLSGCIRAARILEERDLDLGAGDRKIDLLSQLIDKLHHFGGDQLEPTDPMSAQHRTLIRSYASLLLLRSSQHGVGGYSLAQAEDDARQASDLASAIEDIPMVSLALSHLGNCLLIQQKVSEAVEVMARSVGIERTYGTTESLARSLYNLARGAMAAGDYKTTRESVEEALAIYEGDPALPPYGKAFLLNVRQDLHVHHEEYGRALADGLQSLQILKEMNIRDRLPSAHYHLVRLYLRINNPAEAMYHAMEIIPAEWRESAPNADRGFHILAMGAIELELNHTDIAERYYRSGLSLAEATGHRIMESLCLEGLAAIEQRRGKPERAYDILIKALEEEHHLLKRAVILRRLTSISLERKEFDEARKFLDQAISLISQLPGEHRLKEVAIELADVLCAEGKDDEAIPVLLSIAEDPQYRLRTRGDAYQRLYEIHQRQGDADRALHYHRLYHTATVKLAESLAEHRLIALRFSREGQDYQAETERLSEARQQYEKELERLTLEISEQEGKIRKVEDNLRKALGLLARSEVTEGKAVLQGVLRSLKENSYPSLDLLQQLRTIDKEFFSRLDARYPNLTSNQKRLCGLVRLGLNSSEIAAIFNVTPETVATQRKRLRRKLGLPREVTLEQGLSEL